MLNLFSALVPKYKKKPSVYDVILSKVFWSIKTQVSIVKPNPCLYGASSKVFSGILKNEVKYPPLKTNELPSLPVPNTIWGNVVFPVALL